MFSKLFGSKKSEGFVDHSGLSEDQKNALFEKYAFSKFDKKYFKLLNRRSDAPSADFTPDLEYEFRHNAFVRKFSAVVVYKQTSGDGTFEMEKEKLEKIKTFVAANNTELYIILGFGGNASKPDQVFTIPLIHFKTNPVSLDSIEVFKKAPQDDFFYQRDIDCLT